MALVDDVEEDVGCVVIGKIVVYENEIVIEPRSASAVAARSPNENAPLE